MPAQGKLLTPEQIHVLGGLRLEPVQTTRVAATETQ
jgi:hypothetical protein